MHRLSTIALSAILAVSASAATAATFTGVQAGANPRAGGTTAESFTATIAGADVTITGGRIQDDLSGYRAGRVGWDGEGFGVGAVRGTTAADGPDAAPGDGRTSPYTIDGVVNTNGRFTVNEQLTLSFAQEVILTSLSFGDIDLFDDATIRVDGGQPMRFGFGGDESLNAGGIASTLTFDQALRGATFDIIAGFPNQNCTVTATRHCGGATDIFSLTGAELAMANQPAAVPLPAGGLLLLSGLGAVAGLRRRARG